MEVGPEKNKMNFSREEVLFLEMAKKNSNVIPKENPSSVISKIGKISFFLS
jgi:hypothetical protein